MTNKITSLFIAFILLAGLTLTASAQQKKRIAILDFDYATVYSDVGYIFGTNIDVGKGIADLLVTKLVQGGQYSVIERKQLDKIIAEQNLGASGRVDEATAARIGKILGVDALIVGSIHTFGRDDKSKGTGGGINVPVPVFGGVKVGSKKAKATVGINYRMVATDTAEIFTAGDARGEFGGTVRGEAAAQRLWHIVEHRIPGDGSLAQVFAAEIDLLDGAHLVVVAVEDRCALLDLRQQTIRTSDRHHIHRSPSLPGDLPPTLLGMQMVCQTDCGGVGA